jgi:hypothetical protein
MKSLSVVVAAVLILGFAVSTPAMGGGLELKPYGFVKGDMVYASQTVVGFGAPGLRSAQIVPMEDDDIDSATLGFTAMHTRVGLSGTTGTDIVVGGKVEVDYFTSSSFITNLGLRMRQAYASFAKDNIEVRVGQQWDIFSPLNASTVNTNGNMWFAGNVGFRRAMVQGIYKGEQVKVQAALCEGSVAGGSMMHDNNTVMPMFQGRVSGKFDEKYAVGGYFVYATFDPDQNTDDDDYNVTGFGADFAAKLSPKMSVKGEVNMGTNLANANLFTVAGAGMHDCDHKSMGFWANLCGKPSDKFNFVLGGGIDMNTSDDEDMSPMDVEQNMVLYGDAIFPMGHGFSFCVEVASITTSFKEDDVNDITYDDESAFVIDFAGKVAFK